MENSYGRSSHVEQHEVEQFISKRIVIKIGSKTITGGTEELDRNMMNSIAAQVSELFNAGMQVYIVTSGAVACGRHLVNNYDPSDKNAKQRASVRGQPILMSAWQKEFAEYGICVDQILVTEQTLAEAQGLIRSITDGVPIINANDALNDYEIKELSRTADNDKLAEVVAHAVGADTVVLLSDSCVKDINQHPVTMIYPDHSYAEEIIFYGSNGVGTGGMESKHNAALRLAQSGIRTVISSPDEDVILNVAKGKLAGTTYI